MKYSEQEQRVHRANHSLHTRKNATENKNYNREAYNSSVSQAHANQAAEHERIRQANEERIKALEEIE